MEDSHKAEELDYFDPLFIAGAIMAGVSDFAFSFGILGLAIPLIGPVIFFGVYGLHLFAGLFLLPILFRLKHLVPKLILGAAILLPLPTLVLGIALAVVAQNRIIELLLTQAALAVATGGAGNVAAGAAKGVGAAAKGVEMAGGAARGLEAAGEVAEGGTALAEGSGAIVGRAATRKGLRGRIERGLEGRVKDLEKELAEEESVSEEDFGIVEPTDKMRELFEPEFEMQKNEASEAEKPNTSRWIIDPKTGKEIYRRADEGPKANSSADSEQKGGAVDINEDTNEVNLKKAA